MNITKTLNGNQLNIAVEGRLDTTTSPELEAVLKDNLEGVTELCFDLAKLDYISSSGLRVLLAAQKLMNRLGSMKLINVNETVMDIFEVTGFSSILSIE